MPFWVTFGSLGSKTEILGHTVRVSGRSFLCLFPEQNFGDTLGSLGFVFFDDVGIEALCGVHAGVAQLLGDSNNVRTVGQQDRGYRVPEGVGVDVGQAVAGREGIQPAGDTVRVHMLPVVLGKDKAGIDPAVPVGQLQA